MWSLHAPPAERIERFLERQRDLPHSYPEIGESNGGRPKGYELDHNRVRIGTGEQAFLAGKRALTEWKMFPGPWTRIRPIDAPIVTGTVVAMVAHIYGVWWLNACRVVYVIEETEPARRFGFAYGTLPGHVEMGEERFMVEWLSDDSVWYDLRAFSRPRFWAARVAKPLVRGLQRRFVRDSQAAMRRAVESSNS